MNNNSFFLLSNYNKNYTDWDEVQLFISIWRWKIRPDFQQVLRNVCAMSKRIYRSGNMRRFIEDVSNRDI